MSSLLNVIKQAGKDAMEAGSPVVIMFGKVTKESPLEVNVDQRFTLTADFLVIPEQLTRYEITIDTATYTIRSGLQAGDSVILIRMQGGQKFVILDKVVSS